MREKDYLTDFPDPSFFTNCALVCVDLQENDDDQTREPRHITDDEMPGSWKEEGFTAEDVNAANDFAFHVCNPNAARVARACRKMGLSMIFIHWGSRYEDLMDMDPEVRKLLAAGEKNGETRNVYRRSACERPARFLDVQPGEYVLSKTAQDAFTATPLHFMLRNLGIDSLVLMGGHTGACLGKTSKTAKALGYRTLCVEDATNNAFESNRIDHILCCGYDYIVTADDFAQAADGMENGKQIFENAEVSK